MKWFQDLSFRYKLMIPLVLVAGLFFLFAWLTLHRVNVLGEEVSNLVKVDVPVLDDLLQADRDLYQALVAERTLIFAGAGSADHADMEKQHADNVRQARERFDRAAETIRETPQTATPKTQEVIRQFVELRERWEGLTERVVLGLRSETERPRDQHALDLGGALTDLEDLAVAVEPRHRVLLHEPVAAEDLHGQAGRRHGGLGRVHLRG